MEQDELRSKRKEDDKSLPSTEEMKEKRSTSKPKPDQIPKRLAKNGEAEDDDDMISSDDESEEDD